MMTAELNTFITRLEQEKSLVEFYNMKEEIIKTMKQLGGIKTTVKKASAPKKVVEEEKEENGSSK